MTIKINLGFSLKKVNLPTCVSPILDMRPIPRNIILIILKTVTFIYTVSEKTSCEDAPKGVVCDTDDGEHSNLCHLLRSGKTLAYSGPCLVSTRG